MASEFSFADCALPQRHVVLGLPLRDYSVGHRLLFLRQRNPLLWSSQADFDSLPFETQTAWLIEAVTVCNQTFAWRRGLENDQTGELEKKFKADSKKWADARTDLQKQFQSENPKSSLSDWWALEIAKFRNYIAAQTVITDIEHRRDPFPFLPCTSVPEATGRTLGSPYDASLIQFLLSSRLCQNEAEAMEYPFGLAEMHYLTHLEHEGALRIMNSEEIRLRERMEAFDLEWARKEGFKTAEEHRAHIRANAGKAKNSNPPENTIKTGLATAIPSELKEFKETPEQARKRTSDLLAPARKGGFA